MKNCTQNCNTYQDSHKKFFKIHLYSIKSLPYRKGLHMRYLIILCLFSLSIKPMYLESIKKLKSIKKLSDKKLYSLYKDDLNELKETVDKLKTSITSENYETAIGNNMFPITRNIKAETIKDFFYFIVNLTINHTSLQNSNSHKDKDDIDQFIQFYKNTYQIIFDLKYKKDFITLAKQTKSPYKTKQDQKKLICSMCLTTIIMQKLLTLKADITTLSSEVRTRLNNPQNISDFTPLIKKTTYISKNYTSILTFPDKALSYIENIT